MLRKLIFGLLAVFAFCTAATAQDWVARTPLGIGAMHRAHSEYISKHCGNIPVVLSPTLDVGHASVSPETENLLRRTMIGPGVTSNQPLMRAKLAHECGHHVLHRAKLKEPVTLEDMALFGQKSRKRELEADCFMLRSLTLQGDWEALDAWHEDLSDNAPGGLAHPSSAARLVAIHACAA